MGDNYYTNQCYISEDSHIILNFDDILNGSKTKTSVEHEKESDLLVIREQKLKICKFDTHIPRAPINPNKYPVTMATRKCPIIPE